MRKLRGRSIATDLTFSLFGLILLIQVGLLIVFYHRQSRFLHRDLEKKADEYAENLAEVLVVPIWDFDDEQISKIGAFFAQNDLVHAISIMDGNGHPLFRAQSEHDASELIKRSVTVYYDGQPIGRAELQLSLAAHLKDLAWLKQIIIIVLLCSFLIFFLVSRILLQVLMRRPLQGLQEGIDRVASGDYDYQFKDIHHRELEGIAARCRQMASEIKAREKSLQAMNAELRLKVDERKRAEERIRESEAKSKALLDAIPDMMFMFDRQGRFLDYRKGGGELVFAPEQFLHQRVQDLFPQEFVRRFQQHLDRALSTGNIEIYEYELAVNGRPAFFECRLNAVTQQKAVAIVRNITLGKQAAAEKARLEEQLRRAQKMEAIGTLAGGVAHDLNNVLSGLVSYPDLLLLDLDESSPLRDPILNIKNSGEKAANIVQDLLTLARRGVSVAEFVNLNRIITEYLQSPEFQKLKEHHPLCTFNVQLDPRLLSLSGSPVHLAKTVMNLVSNAAEAMPQGGSITIRSHNQYIDRPIRGYDRIEEGDYVVLQVEDNGVGISDEDVERIFEPFYTKKKMGRSGTGLGMAVVWGTVKDHNGYIDVQTCVGQGTTVWVYLPAARQQGQTVSAETNLPDYKGRGECVLVVDDVAEQREIACSILTRLGYQTKAVASGEEALAFLAQTPADLVVLDMIMDPGIDGLETYRRLLAVRPGQRAIIASGFSESNRVKEAQKLGAGPYIKKPYLMESIGLAVRMELDR